MNAKEEALRAFEKWMVDVAKIIVGSTDPYPAGLERDYRQVWLAAIEWSRSQPSACKGIPNPGCDYFAQCGTICNKCGRIHQNHLLVSQPSAQAEAEVFGEPTEYDQEREALVKRVGQCCTGLDPYCAGGCLVEKAIRRLADQRPSAPEPVAQRDWDFPINTVGKLVRGLSTLDQSTPLSTVYLLTINGERKAKALGHVSMSWETIEGHWIAEKPDKNNRTLVFWAYEDERASRLHPSAAEVPAGWPTDEQVERACAALKDAEHMAPGYWERSKEGHWKACWRVCVRAALLAAAPTPPQEGE